MTKQEIKDLVSAKIAGQGTQVDLGGALPTILDAILDAIPEGGASPVAPEPAIAVNLTSFDEEPIESAAELLGITVEELLSLPTQLVISVPDTGCTITRILRLDNEEDDYVRVVFGNTEFEFCVSIRGSERKVTVTNNI